MVKEREETLLPTYNNWLKDKNKYGEDMLLIISKLISTVQRKHNILVDWSKEDPEDFIQDLKLHILKKLDKVKEPTNKRLYCFLYSHIRYAFLLKRREIKNKINNEKKLETINSLYYTSHFHLVGDENLQNISNLLIQGYNHKEVRKILNIKIYTYKKYINKIKLQLINN